MLCLWQTLVWVLRIQHVDFLFWRLIDFVFRFYLGYDVSASPRPGLPSFSPSGASRSKATEHSGDQQWTNKAGWLRPRSHLQLPDGPYLGGEWESTVLSFNFIFLFGVTDCPHSGPLMLLLPVVSCGQSVFALFIWQAVGRECSACSCWHIRTGLVVDRTPCRNRPLLLSR